MTESVAPLTEQSAAPEVLINRPRVDVRIFPGAGFGFQNNLQANPEAFTRLKGIDVKNARVWNSMQSADEVIPHRFEYIANDLRTVLQEHLVSDPDARLAIVVHSLAGAEFGNVIQELLKLDKTLVEKRIKNIDFILMGATGIEGGVSNTLRDIQNLGRLINSQLDSEKPLTDRIAGVEGLFFIPPQDPECQDALAIATKLFGDDEDLSEVVEQLLRFKPDNQYFESLAPKTKVALQEAEARMAVVIKRISNGEVTGDAAKTEFQNCLNERAVLLAPDAKKVYHNTLGNPATPVEYQLALIKKTGMNRLTQALLGFADTGRLGWSFLTGKLRRQLEGLTKLGLDRSQIKFLATKWDVFRPPQQVKKHQQMLSQGQSPEFYELAHSTHSSWMFFADQFAEAVEEIYIGNSPVSRY